MWQRRPLPFGRWCLDGAVVSVQRAGAGAGVTTGGRGVLLAAAAGSSTLLLHAPARTMMKRRQVTTAGDRCRVKCAAPCSGGRGAARARLWSAGRGQRRWQRESLPLTAVHTERKGSLAMASTASSHASRLAPRAVACHAVGPRRGRLHVVAELTSKGRAILPSSIKVDRIMVRTHGGASVARDHGAWGERERQLGRRPAASQEEGTEATPCAALPPALRCRARARLGRSSRACTRPPAAARRRWC